MPMLDVSWVTGDPMLADTFDIIRNVETVSEEKGRMTMTPRTYLNLTGVVTQQDPAELMRREDGQTVPRRIFCASAFAFRGAVEGYQPDIIVWNGTQYTIIQVFPYSRFGQGNYECVAESTKVTDGVQ